MIDADREIVEITCDCGQEHEGRVVGDEGQRLEWFCPTDGKLHSDTNA